MPVSVSVSFVLCGLYSVLCIMLIMTFRIFLVVFFCFCFLKSKISHVSLITFCILTLYFYERSGLHKIWRVGRASVSGDGPTEQSHAIH